MMYKLILGLRKQRYDRHASLSNDLFSDSNINLYVRMLEPMC